MQLVALSGLMPGLSSFLMPSIPMDPDSRARRGLGWLRARGYDPDRNTNLETLDLSEERHCVCAQVGNCSYSQFVRRTNLTDQEAIRCGFISSHVSGSSAERREYRKLTAAFRRALAPPASQAVAA
jgi:hypothetical protein